MDRFRNFMLRHRRKFFIAGVIVSGGYVALKYAQRKLLEYQERQAREFFEKTRRIQHFESTERTCNDAIIRMNSELMQAIIKECSTDDLLRQLRENPPNKIELWEEMKIVAFTRLTAFIYGASMLTVALRIQLNILGGYIYCNVGSKATNNTQDVERKTHISNELKEHYLSLIRYFIYDGGLSELLRLIRAKVIAVMKEIPLSKLLSLADMEQLFWSVQMSINSDPSIDPCTKMTKYLLPSKIPDYINDSALLAKMYNETLDLLESDDVASVCSNNICRGFSLVMDILADKFADTIPSKPTTDVKTSLSNETADFDNNVHSKSKQEICNKNDSKDEDKNNDKLNAFRTSSTINDKLPNINSIRIALAKVIPIISSLTSNGFDRSERKQNLATSLISYYVISDKCKVLGANVYETFSSVLS